MESDRMGALSRLGYLPENGPLYPEMTPLSLLRFFGQARGLSGDRLRGRIDDVVRRCALEAVIEKVDPEAVEGLQAARRHGPGAAA